MPGCAKAGGRSRGRTRTTPARKYKGVSRGKGVLRRKKKTWRDVVRTGISRITQRLQRRRPASASTTARPGDVAAAAAANSGEQEAASSSNGVLRWLRRLACWRGARDGGLNSPLLVEPAAPATVVVPPVEIQMRAIRHEPRLPEPLAQPAFTARGRGGALRNSVLPAPDIPAGITGDYESQVEEYEPPPWSAGGDVCPLSSIEMQMASMERSQAAMLRSSRRIEGVLREEPGAAALV